MALPFALPTFSNEAVAELYTLSTKPADVARIREILAIGEALIPDLERILAFTDEHHDDFALAESDEDAYNETPLHALIMLAELRATSSFDAILQFLSNGDLTEYWLGDTAFTVAEHCYAYCGQTSIGKLQESIWDETLWSAQRSTIASGLGWIGHLFPEHRPGIVEFFRAYLRSDKHQVLDIPEEYIYGKRGFLVAEDDEDVSAMVASQLAFQGYTELREEIELLWASGKAFPGITTIEAVREDLDNPMSAVSSVELLPIQSLEEIYDWIDTPFTPNLDELFREDLPKTIPQDLVKKNPHSTTLVRTEAKIGRNDPCPLDGKKKFKKCCGAKGHTTCHLA